MTIFPTIDMHAHYYGGLVETLAGRSERPFVAPGPDGRPVLHAMTADTAMGADYTDVATRLAFLDASGLDRQVMTFPGALGLDVLPIDEFGGMIRAFNDGLAAICRDSGGRLLGLAGLPLADLEAAAAELRRARAELGLLGAILPGNYFLETATAERLRPVFAAAAESGALLMVHPGLAPGETPPRPFPDHSVYRMSGAALQASLTQMALTLVLGPLLDAYPAVEVQLVNLGGTLPFILERLEAIAESRPPGTPFPRERLRRLHYDAASLGPRALEVAVKVLGADRVMLGSDYPIFKRSPLAALRDAEGLSATERALVAGGTAAALIARATARAQ